VSDLIDNERTKLLANALDRASTACLTVGVLAPVAAVLYNVSGTQTAAWVFVLGAVIWLLAAVALHLIARVVLKGLVP
jgi:multisubunit Na+/H+ antiporter MnhG subunit